MKNKEKIINNNQIASKGKIFLSACLDFCLHMLILMVLYGAVATPILNASGVYNAYNEAKAEFFDYIEDTHLFTFDENKKPINSNIESTNYLKKLVKTSYFFENKEFKELKNGQEELVTLTKKDTIGYQENDLYVNDNIAYYFLNYRNSSESDLPTNIKDDYKEFDTSINYFYNNLLDFDDAETRLYLNEEVFKGEKMTDYVSNKPILDSRYASLLHDYMFMNKVSEEGEKVVTKFNKIYHRAVNMCFEELTNHSEKYKLAYSNINSEETSIYGYQILAIFLTYIVSFNIYFVLIPIFLKEGKTVGLKFNRLTYSTINDYSPEIKNIAIKNLVLFLTQGISMIFPVLFLGSSNILFVSFGIGFRFVYVIIFLALVSLLSIIMTAWGKKHQFLGEYTSLLVQKDTDSLKVSEENAVID